MNTQSLNECLLNAFNAMIRIRRSAGASILTVLLSLLCWTGAANAQSPADSERALPAQIDQPLPAKADITRGFKIIDGDIQMPAKFSPDAVFDLKLWLGGVVFYEFDANVTQANRNAMLAAMNEWSRMTSVVFRAGRNRIGFLEFYIHIQNSTGNNSAVGMIPGGQIMNISSWGSRFIIAHELGHALGLYHEHSRPDRDNFVQIVAGNIQNGQAGQFARLSNTPVYGPYDFDSLMHYDRCSFSTACPVGSTCNCAVGQETVVVLGGNNAAWQSRIGQRDHISYLDGVTIGSLYPRGDFRFVSATHTGTQNGSFLQPYQRLSTGVAATPRGGTVWIQPGDYTDVSLLTKPMTLRAPIGGVTIRPRQTAFGGTLAAVSAASYNGEMAAESIVAAFGENLGAGTAIATALPLPTTLGGVTVRVRDAAGVERPAPLFFVSPTQINYQIPAGSSVGVAGIAVYNGGNIVATGEIPVVAASPGLFSANASGEGVPAASLLRVRGNQQMYEQVARFDQAQNKFVPVPIDLGPEGDQVFLILFGTGFRSAGAEAPLTLTIGGEDAEVLYAGPAPGFVGLDQANVRVPRGLAGKGSVPILLTADNRSANAVTIDVR
ncbi:MAG: M12 family metallopeptidase [Blastocatellia bacterium]